MSKKEESEEKKQMVPSKVTNTILLVLVMLNLFFVPLIPLSLHHNIYSLLFTAIFITGTQLISKNRKGILTLAILAISMTWISDAMNLELIMGISKGINIVLFIFIVLDLVKQVSRAKMVTPKVIMEAINGYLLIGLVFSIVVAMLMSINPGSFSFDRINPQPVTNGYPLSQFIYYTFITMATVGYGDVVPLTPLARSTSILISVTGQLYIAVVIAVLVGKYISQHGRSVH